MKHLKPIGIIFVTTAICAVALLFNQGTRGESATNLTGATLPAPEWELKDTDGKSVHSADFKGKVVILNFWATWCGPCRAEIPGFIALQKQYEQQGLMIVGMSVDEQGAAAVRLFAQKLGINYSVLLADEKTQQAFGGIEAVPTTFIVDRGGHIVKKHLGLADEDEFEKDIKPLLSPQAGFTGVVR
jgi:DsbE subfamily thiol:disulfide oxidoreductase